MILEQLLEEFYIKNGLPPKGGIDEDTFHIKVFGITFHSPNPQFRKDVVHIHDIQHIINDCDTSWEGEGFISGWEIATGMWKYFPVGFLSLLAMGYSLWIAPKAVFGGFRKGLNNKGIIDLKLSKAELLAMDVETLTASITKEKAVQMRLWQWSEFLFWSLISQVVFLSPFLIIILIINFVL